MKKKNYSFYAFVLFIFALFLNSTPINSQTAYVTNRNDSNVSVIKIADNTEVGTISVGFQPIGICANADGSKIFVANYGGGSISVISTATNTVVETIGVASQPRELKLNPAGTKLFVVNHGADLVTVIDPNNYEILTTFPVGDSPADLDFSPDGSRVYVTAFDDETLSIVDANNYSTLFTATNIGSEPGEIIVSSNGSYAYIVDYSLGGMMRYNTGTNTIDATVSLGGSPEGAAISPDGTKMYVSRKTSGNVAVVDLLQNETDLSISSGDNPGAMTINADGSRLYVVDGLGYVRVLNTNTNQSVGSIPVGDFPQGIVLIPNNTFTILEGNSCDDATNISSLFGAGDGQAQVSTLFDNSDHTFLPSNDPTFGIECFEDGPELARTIWFSFIGDGNTYSITTIECNSTNYNNDTQMAIYSGSCNDLSPVVCNEDEEYNTGLWNAFVELETEPGDPYFIMIDGYNTSAGEFCVEVTQQGSVSSPTQDDFVGTWRMAPQAEAMVVGPTPGSAEWWFNSIDDVTTRACFFDDTFVFSADGTFKNVMGSETWLEPWQGVDTDACGAPLAPHDGSTDGTWAYASNQIMITGVGSHLALPKVFNGGELFSPTDAPGSITYDLYELSADKKTMTLDISIGGGWWRFVLVKDDPTSTSYIDQELFSFYPNPTTGEVHLKNVEADKIEVFDNLGRQVKTLIQPGKSFDISNLPAGIYILKITSGDEFFSAKVSKY